MLPPPIAPAGVRILAASKASSTGSITSAKLAAGPVLTVATTCCTSFRPAPVSLTDPENTGSRF